MTETTDFITELIIAANQIDSVAPFERRRLLERAAATTKALWELLLSNKVVPMSSGLQREIERMVPEAETAPEVLMAGVLLLAAEEIRRLRILTRQS